MLCGNVSEVPVSCDCLGCVVESVVLALTSGVKSVVTAVVVSTKYVFCLDYPGLLMLIPLYLKEIKKILDLDNGYPYSAISAAVTILGSLLALPDHYSGYTLPPLPQQPESFQMQDLRRPIYGSIEYVLAQYETTPASPPKFLKAINKAVCCATVIVNQEMLKSEPDMDTVKVNFEATIDAHKRNTNKGER